MKFNGSFGSWLKQRRKALDLTQAELADQVGCAVVTIQKFERDLARPSKSMTEVLAEVLVIADEERAAFTAFARRKPSSLPALPTSASQPTQGNLPPQPFPLVGRQSELTDLDAQMAKVDCRLLTVVGEGGMGKTRLAIEAARELSANFSDGVYFISLAPLGDPELIVPAMADAVGFQFYPGGTPKQQLLDFFRAKSMLLIMDNFEHLLPGALFVSDILQFAPKVKIIATSRERLNLQEERLFRLAGMDLPAADSIDVAADCGSITLFMDIAQRVQPSLELTSENVADVVHICQQVEGMPLGILLAAAWVDSLSLREISEEMARSFDFLETEARNVPDRQRSIRAVFDHSWQMLAANEQAVFSKLSVFRGGFNREEAQFVAGATIKTLAALVNKSFIRRHADGRYDIHELLRQYGDAKLNAMPGALETTQTEHCFYFAELMDKQAPRLKSAAEKEALTLIETELDNVRTAWDFALAAEQFDMIGQALEALALFSYIKSTYKPEIEQRLHKTIETLRPCVATVPERVLLGQLLARLAFFSSANRHPEVAASAFSEAESLLRASTAEYELATAHLWWAIARLFMFDVARGQEREELLAHQQRSLLIFEANGDGWSVAATHATLAAIYNMNFDFSGAEATAKKSLALVQAIGSRFWQILPLTVLGGIASSQSEFTNAIGYSTQIMNFSEEVGHDAVSYSLQFIGENYSRLGDYAQAKTHFGMALAQHERRGDRLGMARTIEFSGHAAKDAQLYPEAYGYFQQALPLLHELGRQADIANIYDTMGIVAMRQGNYSLAEQHCREALILCSDYMASYWGEVVEAVFHVGYLTAKAGNVARSITLFTVGLETWEHWNKIGQVLPWHYDWMRSLGQKYLDEIRAETPPAMFAAAQEAAKSLDLERVAAEILASPLLFPNA